MCIRDRHGNEYDVQPLRVGHVVLNVVSVKDSLILYRVFLGFEVVKEVYDTQGVATAAFLSCGKIHHDLALFEADKNPETGRADPIQHGKKTLGLNHVAFQVPSFEMLNDYYKILKDCRMTRHDGSPYDPNDRAAGYYQEPIILRTTDHGMTSSIYITDPDGIGVELFCNNQEDPAEGLEIMKDDARENTELTFA